MKKNEPLPSLSQTFTFVSVYTIDIMKLEFAIAAILFSATIFGIPIEDDDEVEADEDECDCKLYTYEFCQKLDKEFLSTKKTCKWKSKAEWSECSETCGNGLQTRPRKCSCSFGYGNAKCDGPAIEERMCLDLVPCEIAAPPVTEASCSDRYKKSGTQNREKKRKIVKFAKILKTRNKRKVS